MNGWLQKIAKKAPGFLRGRVSFIPAAFIVLIIAFLFSDMVGRLFDLDEFGAAEYVPVNLETKIYPCKPNLYDTSDCSPIYEKKSSHIAVRDEELTRKLRENYQPADVMYIVSRMTLSTSEKSEIFSSLNQGTSQSELEIYGVLKRVDLMVSGLSARSFFMSAVSPSPSSGLLIDSPVYYHRSVSHLGSTFGLPLAFETFDTLQFEIRTQAGVLLTGPDQVAKISFVKADAAGDFQSGFIRKFFQTKVYDIALLLVALSVMCLGVFRRQKTMLWASLPLVLLGLKQYVGGISVDAKFVDADSFDLKWVLYHLLYIAYSVSICLYGKSLLLRETFLVRRRYSLVLFAVLSGAGIFGLAAWKDDLVVSLSNDSFRFVLESTSLIVLALGSAFSVAAFKRDYQNVPFRSLSGIKIQAGVHFAFVFLFTSFGAALAFFDLESIFFGSGDHIGTGVHYAFYTLFMCMVVNRAVLDMRLDDSLSESLRVINETKTSILALDRQSSKQDGYIFTAASLLRRLFVDQTDVKVSVDYRTVSEGRSKEKRFELGADDEFDVALSQVTNTFASAGVESVMDTEITSGASEVCLNISPDETNYYRFKFKLGRDNPYYTSTEFKTALAGAARLLSSDIGDFIGREIEASFCPPFLQRLMGKNSVKEIKIGDKAVFNAFMIKADMAGWTNWRNSVLSSQGRSSGYDPGAEFERLIEIYKGLWEDEFKSPDDGASDSWRFRFDYAGDSYHAALGEGHDIYDFMKTHFARHERLSEREGIPPLRAAISFGELTYAAEKGSTGIDFNFDGAPFVLSARFEPVAKILGLNTLVTYVEPGSYPEEALYAGQYYVQGYSSPLEVRSFYLEIANRDEAAALSRAVRHIFLSDDRVKIEKAVLHLKQSPYSFKLTRGLIKYADYLLKTGQNLEEARAFNFSGKNVEKEISDFEQFVDNLLEVKYAEHGFQNIESAS